jgi:hypothetical protein
MEQCVALVSPNDVSNLSDIFAAENIHYISVARVDLIPSQYNCGQLSAVIFENPIEEGVLVTDSDISWIRRHFSTAFICVHLPEATENPTKRLTLFDAGANMVSHDTASIVHILRSVVISQGKNGGALICPYCGQSDLTEDELWVHCTFPINLYRISIAIDNLVFVRSNIPYIVAK